MDAKSNASLLYTVTANKAKCVLGYFRRTQEGRLQEGSGGIIAPLYSVLARLLSRRKSSSCSEVLQSWREPRGGLWDTRGPSTCGLQEG